MGVGRGRGDVGGGGSITLEGACEGAVKEREERVTSGSANSRNKVGRRARLFSKNVMVQSGWIIMGLMPLLGDIG